MLLDLTNLFPKYRQRSDLKVSEQSHSSAIEECSAQPSEVLGRAENQSTADTVAQLPTHTPKDKQACLEPTDTTNKSQANNLFTQRLPYFKSGVNRCAKPTGEKLSGVLNPNVPAFGPRKESIPKDSLPGVGSSPPEKRSLGNLNPRGELNTNHDEVSSLDCGSPVNQSTKVEESKVLASDVASMPKSSAKPIRSAIIGKLLQKYWYNSSSGDTTAEGVTMSGLRSMEKIDLPAPVKFNPEIAKENRYPAPVWNNLQSQRKDKQPPPVQASNSKKEKADKRPAPVQSKPQKEKVDKQQTPVQVNPQKEKVDKQTIPVQASLQIEKVDKQTTSAQANPQKKKEGIQSVPVQANPQKKKKDKQPAPAQNIPKKINEIKQPAPAQAKPEEKKGGGDSISVQPPSQKLEVDESNASLQAISGIIHEYESLPVEFGSDLAEHFRNFSLGAFRSEAQNSSTPKDTALESSSTSEVRDYPTDCSTNLALMLNLFLINFVNPWNIQEKRPF